MRRIVSQREDQHLHVKLERSMVTFVVYVDSNSSCDNQYGQEHYDANNRNHNSCVNSSHTVRCTTYRK